MPQTTPYAARTRIFARVNPLNAKMSPEETVVDRTAADGYTSK